MKSKTNSGIITFKLLLSFSFLIKSNLELFLLLIFGIYEFLFLYESIVESSSEEFFEFSFNSFLKLFSLFFLLFLFFNYLIAIGYIFLIYS